MESFFKENWFKVCLIIILTLGISLIAYYILVLVPSKNKVEQERQAYSQKLESYELDKKESMQQVEKCKSLADEFLKNQKDGDIFSTYIREVHFNKRLNTCLVHSETSMIDTISKPTTIYKIEFVTDLLTNKRLIRSDYKNNIPSYDAGGLTPSEFRSQKNQLMSE